MIAEMCPFYSITVDCGDNSVSEQVETVSLIYTFPVDDSTSERGDRRTAHLRNEPPHPHLLMTHDRFRVIVDGKKLTITPTTTVAEVKEQVGAAANTVLIYGSDDGSIHVLEHTDVIASHVDAGATLTVLPVADHYPQLEQSLEPLRESGGSRRFESSNPPK